MPKKKKNMEENLPEEISSSAPLLRRGDGGEASSGDEAMHAQLPVSGMFENWFLDYASYVILERAVPAVEDGLKPVQRRILHAMKEMDDGRFNKVANIIGQTMQYHPHGDAAIGDAMVGLGQKELIIETQGNWGDIRTGDSAAAPRYIEARLSKFALDVAFNDETTTWQLSYDGRKREPVTLPMKFPLLLAQGVEGIAVGLATKILPHNFIELIKGSIEVLKDRSPKILPDFPTGGLVDVTDYNLGKRGGRVRVRAKIEEADKKILIIREIPFGTNTTSLIESILKANEKGKIKVKRVTDNTAKDVEIVIELQPGISTDVAIDALYAFTDCEQSISPNACVIVNDKPEFLNVNDMLRISTQNTLDLLKRELQNDLKRLEEAWHFSSLEKIFIEKRIYRNIEEAETWEEVIEVIDKGLKPYKKLFKRDVTTEDITKLTEIKIKRISKFDAKKADELLKGVEKNIEQTKYDLKHLNDFAIAYFEKLLEKYGKGRERKTEVRTFDTIQAKEIAVVNTKLYVNREEGFVGSGLKKDEFLCDCSDMDDVIAFTADGKLRVVRVADKAFIGKNIIHVAIWKKDENTVYNMLYADPGSGNVYAKRFAVTGITRDKEYDLTRGHEKSKTVYFSVNPNGEAEVVNVTLSSSAKARIKVFDFDFSELAVKGRDSMGNIVTKYGVKKVVLKQKGVAKLVAKKIWYDAEVGRLNVEERGKLLGEFTPDDRILCIYKDGTYEITNSELTHRFEPTLVELIEKFDPKKIISAIYYNADDKAYFSKRFQIETTTLDQKYKFISESEGSRLEIVSLSDVIVVSFNYQKKGEREKSPHKYALTAEAAVKGWKAIGTKMNFTNISSLKIEKEEKMSQKAAIAEIPFDLQKKEEAKSKVKPAPKSKATSSKSKSGKKKDKELKVGSQIEWKFD